GVAVVCARLLRSQSSPCTWGTGRAVKAWHCALPERLGQTVSTAVLTRGNRRGTVEIECSSLFLPIDGPWRACPMAITRWLKQILSHYGVPYEVHHHSPVYSAQQLAEAEHMTGWRVAKTVFLTEHGQPIGVVLPASARLDLARVQTVLGIPDLRLATET